MIATERLILRPMAESDLVPLSRALNNLRVVRNTGRIPWPYRLDDAAGYLRRAREIGAGSLQLVIVRKADPQDIAGGITDEAEAAGHVAELGYWLAEAQWGKGYGFEAARAVTAHAFAVAGHERLVASYHLGNEASRRILDRLGFRVTHHARAFSQGSGGKVATAVLELTRPEWLRTPCSRSS